MPKNWLNDLESEVARAGRARSFEDAPLPPVVQKIDNSKLVLPLFLLVCLLVAGVVGAILYKQRNMSSGYSPYTRVNSDWTPNGAGNQGWAPGRDRGSDELEKLKRRSAWNSDVVTLVSIVQNHNLFVTANGYPKSDYIYINADWTIDKLPNHVYLDSQSREFLERFVVKR